MVDYSVSRNEGRIKMNKEEIILYTEVMTTVQEIATEFFKIGSWDYEWIKETTCEVKLLHGSQPDSMEEGAGYVYAKCILKDNSEWFVMCYIEDGTIETQFLHEIGKKVVLNN